MPSSQAGGAAVASEEAGLEFRGIMTTGQGRVFGFYSPQTKASQWIPENKTGGDIVVKGYNVGTGVVTVETKGRVLSLKLPESKIGVMTAAQMAAPAPAAVGPVNLQQPIPQPPVVLNPTPADDAKRLESISAEVRRRRALRQQTTQTGGTQPVQTGQPAQGNPPAGTAPRQP